jgi:hypothetical protein
VIARRLRLVALATSVVAASACVQRLDRKQGPTLHSIDRRAPYLKVHMRDGMLYVLSTWRADDLNRRIVGDGERLGIGRASRERGADFVIPYDDVALFETNTIVTSPAVAAMAIITIASVAVTAACATHPKSCFGSCPTFYAPADDGGALALQAEGFSDAIAPSLETHDIDSLWRTTGRGGAFVLTLTNEAYETHVVKRADLLVVPRPPGGRVVATRDRLWLASSLAAPTRCTAAEGDCLDRVVALDGRERASLADAHDLAARETIELAFPRAMPGKKALVIGARQGLVTTFLLYQGLAYLGTRAGDWLAKLERGGRDERAGGNAFERLVGGIEVQLERDGEWQTVGSVYETGPLATDVHAVLLPDDATVASGAGEAGSRVRLRVQKGGWRIDYVALATIAGEATPLRLAPTRVHGELGREFAADRVAATALPIVTLPGDRYELDYELPPGDDYELFVDSRGYYLEWMREAWLRDEDPLAAMRMFADPAAAMRELAPAYKRLEPDIERAFWSSRYARP